MVGMIHILSVAQFRFLSALHDYSHSSVKKGCFDSVSLPHVISFLHLLYH